uniref:histone deacetylase n=1 Tax=Macrostomum lignano TaxID=282301 RepID=A0A1I8FNT6_9PLAT
LLMEKTANSKVPPTMGMSDLRREHELALVQLCGNIPVFVTDFPVKSRPFYCAESSPGLSASFDLLLPGVGEVLGGSVRESDSTRLNQSIKRRHQLLESSVERLHWYLELRRFGSAPHGGYGLGVDRFSQISTERSAAKVRGRSVLVHSLIHAYKLLDRLTVLSDLKTLPESALLGFHSEAYLSALKRFAARFDIASLVAGATVAAAEALSAGQFDVAINWTGGWHHAKRDEASGFCYINDIVYGVLELKKRYDRVMYIDLDLHHGDGVEEAGDSSDDIGAGPGRFASVNVPLKEGVSDAQFAASFAAVIDAAFEAFDPGAVAAGPLLSLGGGGYHFPSTAKLWTAITALADVTPSLKRNLNDSTELRLLVESAVENLKRLAEALAV